MKKIKDFRDLIVWQKSIQLFKDACEDVEKFPNKRAAWVIEEQIIDSIGSISSNIAEGFGRKGQNEYAHFLGIAKGSASESSDWYEKVKLLKYLPENLIDSRIATLDEIRKMLNVLISKIQSTSR